MSENSVPSSENYMHVCFWRLQSGFFFTALCHVLQMPSQSLYEPSIIPSLSHCLACICLLQLRIWKNTEPILEYRYVTNRGFSPLLNCTLCLLTRASTATYRPCVLQEQTSKSRLKTNFFQSKRWRAKKKLGQLYNRLLARQAG